VLFHEKFVSASTELVSWIEKFAALTGERVMMSVPNHETQENLTTLTNMLIDIKERVRSATEAIRFLRRREEIVLKQQEMLNSQSISGRLLNKKGGMTARLLQEEKDRRAIKKELPKIDLTLRKFAPDWLAKQGYPFVWNGKTVAEILEIGRDYHPPTHVVDTGSVHGTPKNMKKRPAENDAVDASAHKRSKPNNEIIRSPFGTRSNSIFSPNARATPVKRISVQKQSTTVNNQTPFKSPAAVNLFSRSVSRIPVHNVPVKRQT
jgi:hypothetical protein